MYRLQERPLTVDAFLADLEECYRSIARHPNGYQIRYGEYRHAMLKNFPYRVVYRVGPEHIIVVQVRHASRRPSKRFGP